MAKILVIDDEKIIRERLKSLLELDDYETFTAESGPKGLEIFDIEKPEIALVDIKMPGMDGIEVLKKIKEKSKETEVIIITGHGGVDAAIQAMRESAFDYIQKPIEYDELEIDIKRALEKQELQRKLDEYVHNLEEAVEEKTRELTKRKRAEEALRVSHRFLEIANRHTEMEPLLKEFIVEVQNFTGCAAVGLRILDEEGNIPYQAYEGLSQRFYLEESPLCIKSDECMCTNVIKGETDAKLPFYTEGGSFYMNGTTRFLATVSEEGKGWTRNVCNQVGYESVALFPIRLGDRILGLIHVADTQENMVPLELVETLEKVAMQLGAAIQRVQSEEALRESEEKYRLIFVNAKEGISIYEEPPDGGRKLVECNPQYAEMSGCSREELMPIGNTLKIQVGHDTPQQEAVNMEKALAGEPYSGLFSWIRPDGKENYIEYTAAPFNVGDRKFTVGIDHDITERKRAEEAIMRQNEELAVRNTIAAVVSESLNLDELLNKVIDKVMEVIDTDSVIIRLVGEEAKSARVAAHRGLPPEVIEELNKMPFSKGIMPQVILSSEPYIVEDSLKEARFSESEKKVGRQYRSGIAIPLKSKNKVLGIMGLGRKEPASFSPDSLPLLTSIGNQIGMAIENANLYKNMEKRVKERTADLQAANARLEQAYKKLKETQSQLIHSARLAAVGQLAAGVAHEINNFLGAVSGYTEILQGKEYVNETVSRYLARIEKRVDDAARIVTGLKDFSGRTLQADLNLKPTDVNQVLQQALELVEGQMEHENIEVIKDFEEHLPEITADAGRLQQVFLNIILNAKDAMPDGGKLTIKSSGRSLSRPTVAEERYIQLLFVDTGVGMRKEQINRIFEPFFTTKEVGQGTGLGLSVSYGIIKEHSGYIDVWSQEGRGSIFRIILPTEKAKNCWEIMNCTEKEKCIAYKEREGHRCWTFPEETYCQIAGLRPEGCKKCEVYLSNAVAPLDGL